jgi:DNA polymerase-3 subunit gamma/tau
MENFIVSARKYRPATFDTVIGQKSITTTLKNAIKHDHLAQAFLFCGPRGIGKTTCARILAKTINCENISDNIEPCNQCESCISFNKSASFNILELDAASNNSVDDIRSLAEQVRIPPQVGKYKVYIIDEVHMLSQQAFNAFLKTLEEPPSYTKFILATTEKHKIIPTILSRCQVFDFKRISVEDIIKHLAYVAKNEGIEATEDALHIIAQKADGALRDALSIFDQLVSFSGNELTYDIVIQNLNVLDYDYYFKITDFILNSDTSNTLMTINEIIDNGFDGRHFLIGMGEHLRNLLVCKDKSTISLLEVSPSLKEKYQVQSARCSEKFLLKALEINNQYDINYKTSNNKNLHLEISLMQMCSINANHHPIEKKNHIISPPVKKPIEETVKTPEKQKQTATEIKPAIPVTEESKKATTRLPGTISIKKATKANNQKKENNIHNNQNGPVADKPAKPFKQEELEKAWTFFSESIAHDSPNLYSTLTKRKPELKEDFKIELVIDNKVQDKEISERKSDILDFLREELANYHIRLETIILENHDKSKAYFPKEIYINLVETNPSIKKLKDQLDLDIDF